MITQQTFLPIGTVLHGTYRIDGHIASGGFGNTYKVTHLQLEKQMAVKEFFIKGINQRDEDSTTVSVSNSDNSGVFEQQREKFKKEARRLWSLNNPHIVRVHDLFEENGTVYYVMDFIDGESLSSRLKRTGRPLSESEALDIMKQVLDALKCIHAQGIYHLDLKPANIMVDKQGVAMLIDFGASKQLDGENAATSTAVSFTNGYAPREQLERNQSKFGPWTDLYALGATMYNLLTNQKPPMPSDIDDDESPDKHEALPMPGVSIRMKDLILWLMQTGMRKRPQDVGAVESYLNSNQTMAVEKPTPQNSVIDNFDEATRIAPANQNKPKARMVNNKDNKIKITKVDDDSPTAGKDIAKTTFVIAIGIIVFGFIYFFINIGGTNNYHDSYYSADSTVTDTAVVDSAADYEEYADSTAEPEIGDADPYVNPY